MLFGLDILPNHTGYPLWLLAGLLIASVLLVAGIVVGACSMQPMSLNPVIRLLECTYLRSVSRLMLTLSVYTIGVTCIVFMGIDVRIMDEAGVVSFPLAATFVLVGLATACSAGVVASFTYDVCKARRFYKIMREAVKY